MSGQGAGPDYDLSYRDVFWRSRAYEDGCDRTALRALLPRSGDRLLDLGAGFGRLANEYRCFRSVVLVDTSQALLAAARARFADDARIEVRASEATQLPFPDDSFDVVVAVRLAVHFHDLLPLFQEAARVLRPMGRLIVEYPNRRHALAGLRYLTGRQRWAPARVSPHEYLTDHFAHHPTQIRRQLEQAGLSIDATRAVSLFRAAWLKDRVAPTTLVRIEAPFQAVLGRLFLSPSVYVRAVKG